MQIDVCFLNILNCERALDAIALKYVNGDSSVGAAGFFLLEGIRGIHPTSRKIFPTPPPRSLPAPRTIPHTKFLPYPPPLPPPKVNSSPTKQQLSSYNPTKTAFLAVVIVPAPFLF